MLKETKNKMTAETNEPNNAEVSKKLLKRKRLESSKSPSKKQKLNSMKLKKKKISRKQNEKETSNIAKAINAEESKKVHKSKSGKSSKSPTKMQKLLSMKFKERKLVRKETEKETFDVAKALKMHWEDLRCEDCPPEKKDKLLKQICNLLKGRVMEFAFAHDTTRVLECVFAEGNEEHRNFMFEEIKDRLNDLSKSKYGKYIVLKILRYGSKQQKEDIMKTFHGNVVKLMNHSDAALVVELAFNECANASQRFQLVQEFFGANYRHFKETDVHNLTELLEKKPEEKTTIISFMKNELLKILGKSVVNHSLIHQVLLQFFLNCDDASRSDIIESLRELISEILHTKDGSRVAMHCIWNGNRKDRKVIIKNMKSFVKKIAMEEYGHMVLLALFDCVDDTILIDKVIIKELHENLLEISQNLYGRKVLVYLLNSRDPHCFHPDVINILKTGDNNATSKKEPEKRRQELRVAISEPLSELIANNIADLYKNNSFCHFTVTILKNIVGHKRKAFESIAKLAAEPYTSENKNVNVIEYSGSNFMLKQLIMHDKLIYESKQENEDPDTFSEVLVSTIPKDIMKTWFQCNRGAFLLLNLLETEIPVVVKRVAEELMGSRKKLDKLNFKGAELLVQRLRKIPVDSL